MTKAELTATNEELIARLEAKEAAVVNLMAYLMGDKFANDPTVQVRDVLNRLAPVMEA